MELFYEQWQSYAKEWEIVGENMRKVMQDFAEKMKPVRAYCILGEHQFTYWKPLCLDEIEEIVSTGDVNKYLIYYLDKNNGRIKKNIVSLRSRRQTSKI